ncbi:hypothetical protein [Bifidobacterium callitrichidarum]|uniref:Uncharacterized protein n=1 Tax=Bifidobacterium callitrichidarum TaxID=2052941 RepID=A0A2U2NCB8_9BIFI|nr:hypothetical protein [Bifidobacterium callitrichidarum]PWG66737.1 hypothetical protein DF196_02205 [Bifidobacterium callitrichidarum]
MSNEIRFRINGQVFESGEQDMGMALLTAGFMANRVNKTCVVLVDWKRVAIIHPHQSHAHDASYLPLIRESEQVGIEEQ